MHTIAERIRQGMNLRDIKQSDLARITGIGKSSISTYLSGEYEPKQKNIYKIATALNVSEAWLMGYDVPLERETSHDNETKKPAITNDDRLSSAEKQLITLFRQVPEDKQDFLLSTIEAVLKNQGLLK